MNEESKLRRFVPFDPSKHTKEQIAADAGIPNVVEVFERTKSGDKNPEWETATVQHYYVP